MFGFMGKILRVDLTAGKVWDEPIPVDLARQFLGGAGLATRYLYDEVPPGTDPLGPDNRLIFMAGPLTGTTSPSASRYSVVTKSPLTGIWGQANSGGSFGPALKKSGYDGIIFQGMSEKPVYLKIEEGRAVLQDAEYLWGRNVPDTEDRLKEELGKEFTVASIGPAGENRVKYAAIMNNKHRAAGRCGVGAVMGSKKVKAIAVSGKAAPVLANREVFQETAKKQYELINESLLKIGFETFGTAMVADMVNVKGGYPTHNWQSGEFEEIEAVNAQAISDKVLISRVNCFACPIACGRASEIKEGPYQGHKGEGPEYESSNTLGAQCGVADINTITMANFLCNEYGLDTISAGSTIAFAMECFEKGILTTQETGGLDIHFGDGDLVVELIRKIAHREGIGDLLAEGTKRMAERLGRGSERFAMNVKGLELPAYDPRAAKIVGLSYVTANRGGDHVTGTIIAPTFIDSPILLVDDSHIEDPLVVNPAEAKILADLENGCTVFDCVGGCKFMGLLFYAQDYVQLIANATGWDFSVEDFRRGGERVYNLIRAFCVREGITREKDTLPARLLEDPLPSGSAAGMVIERADLEKLKDAYYDYRGWDRETGKPKPEKLKELGLEDLIADLWGPGGII
ncbi:MAG: aldehyde ferredoxin oxidoreductase family protein [Deltaproteobacteria bacterium]|nr:aldehyde ferredoxin oxidoreductase family protein [Deltaproteobacteria bacterium]